MFRPLVLAGARLRRSYSVSSSEEFLAKYGDAWQNHDIAILSQAGSDYLNETLNTAANQLTLSRDPLQVATNLYDSVKCMPGPSTKHYVGYHIFKDFKNALSHLVRLRHIPEHLRVDYLRTGFKFVNCHPVLFDLKYRTWFGVAGLQDHRAHEPDSIEVLPTSHDSPFRNCTNAPTRFYTYYDNASLGCSVNFGYLGSDLSSVQNDYIKKMLLKMVANDHNVAIMMNNPDLIKTMIKNPNIVFQGNSDLSNLKPHKYLEAFRNIAIHMKNSGNEDHMLSLHMYLGLVPITVWNADVSRGMPDHLGIGEII